VRNVPSARLIKCTSQLVNGYGWKPLLHPHFQRPCLYPPSDDTIRPRSGIGWRAMVPPETQTAVFQPDFFGRHCVHLLQTIFLMLQQAAGQTWVERGWLRANALTYPEIVMGFLSGEFLGSTSASCRNLSVAQQPAKDCRSGFATRWTSTHKIHPSTSEMRQSQRAGPCLSAETNQESRALSFCFSAHDAVDRWTLKNRSDVDSLPQVAGHSGCPFFHSSWRAISVESLQRHLATLISRMYERVTYTVM